VPFKLIVFDLDGTLVDSLRDIADAANLVLESSGAAPLAEEAIGRMVGDGAATLVARAFAAAGRTPPSDALERFFAFYGGSLLATTRAYPGVHDVLEAIAPRVPVAVLTNKPTAFARAILSGLDLARYFPSGCVLGGDGPLPRKPDAAGLVAIASEAGVDLADTLLVGDSEVDWRTARAARSRLCLARYGFGFATFPAAQIGRDDFVIDTPLQLLSL
jgi:phosphoglycolate phosphatase